MNNSTYRLTLDMHDSVVQKCFNIKRQDNAREIKITLSDNGKVYQIADGCTATFRAKKPDGTILFNNCSIENNVITYILTNQTSSATGDVECEVTLYDSEAKQITSPRFGFAVMDTLYDDSEIESTNEFTKLAETMAVVGSLPDILEGCLTAEANALESEQKALESEQKAYESELTTARNVEITTAHATQTTEDRLAVETNKALVAEDKATIDGYKDEIDADMLDIRLTRDIVSGYAESAKDSKEEAKVYRDNAESFANNAKTSEDNAKTSENTALTYLNSTRELNDIAKSYAIGGTGTREGEDTDNASYYATQSRELAIGDSESAKYYYEQAKLISESFSGALRPMGTVSFEELPSPTGATEGDMYNISNEFVTTDDFEEGAGVSVPLGSNVFCTTNKKWDVLAGSPVTGVKGDSESTYRRGNVNITKSNIGLSNVPNVSTNNQTPTYTVATSDEELSSGEKLSVAFGKIAKAVKSLISHMADSVAHITSSERTAWNGYNGRLDTVDSEITQINNDLSVIRSHVGMIIHSTTLDTEEKVKAIYGGTTWTKLEGVMLLGASASYAIGSTGGSATNTISVDNLPSHNHTVGAHAHGLNSHTHSFGHTHGTDSKGSHQHDYYLAQNMTVANGNYTTSEVSQSKYLTQTFKTGSSGAHTHTTNSQSTSTTGGASGNTANSSQFNSGSTGSGKAINNLPPYKSVYIWERTA